MEENTIAIKFVGNEQAGGGVQPRPPVGSSQDTADTASGDIRSNRDLEEAFSEAIKNSRPAGNTDSASLRHNPDLDDLFGVETTTTAGAPTASQLMREREEEARRAREEAEAGKTSIERDRGEDDYEERRDRVFSGLGRQAAAEQARQQREDEQQRQKEERELNADLKKQYREQQAAEKAEKREWDAHVRKQKASLDKEEKEKKAAEKKAEQDAKAADQDQRLRFLQFGQGAGQLANSQGVGGKVGGLAQLAGSGFLGKKAEAFANSPAGGMIAAAGAMIDAADHTIKNVFAAQREAVRGVGNVGKSIFANDYGGAANQAVEGVASVFEKIPIAGTILAESMRSTADAVNVFGELVQSAAQRGKELEKYSAGIAGTAAQAEVRTLMRDVQEAQRNEGTYSRIIDAQSRLDDTQRAVFDPIKDALLSALADVVEPLADIAQDVKPILQFAAKGVGFIIKMEAAGATFPLKALAALVDWAATKFIPDWMKEEDIPDLLKELDKTVENIRNGTAFRGPEPDKKPERDNKMKAPKFFG